MGMYVYIYLLYFNFIIGFETFSPGFIIGFETSELKKCWYRNSWLWFRNYLKHHNCDP